MLTLSVHYEPLNSNKPLKCERVVEFLIGFFVMNPILSDLAILCKLGL